MKIEYKNIIGMIDNDSVRCLDCCFYNLKNYCMPYHIHQCRNYIFKGVNTQIFDL